MILMLSRSLLTHSSTGSKPVYSMLRISSSLSIPISFYLSSSDNIIRAAKLLEFVEKYFVTWCKGGTKIIPLINHNIVLPIGITILFIQVENESIERLIASASSKVYKVCTKISTSREKWNNVLRAIATGLIMLSTTTLS